jgi:hypothetical protein
MKDPGSRVQWPFGKKITIRKAAQLPLVVSKNA